MQCTKNFLPFALPNLQNLSVMSVTFFSTLDLNRVYQKHVERMNYVRMGLTKKLVQSCLI